MVESIYLHLLIVLLNLLTISCNSAVLKEVSTENFSKFIATTNYITDAERYGWSIVQKDVFDFQVLYGIDWRCPDGLRWALPDEPVRQVSYNDALAYVNWSGSRLPSYEQYWELVKPDNGNINENGTQIFEIGKSNIIGNTWEITSPDQFGRIRLAGGSYLCNTNTCKGTSPDRELYVDQITGNSHIGFAIVKEK